MLAIARVTLLHADFPGRMCKEGNMAFPFSPSDIERGAGVRFSVFRTSSSPTIRSQMFPIEYENV